MKERTHVKFRVDMLSDIKAKIIDMKPERDLIHYVWMALVLLAGKVDLEGDLYMSKSIPYTIETLAIEFNRGSYQVKLALDVLMELEMIEITENNVYRVKNFVKHQNIKTKEKSKFKVKEEKIENNEIEIKENPINKAKIAVEDVPVVELAVKEDEAIKNKISKSKEENTKENLMGNLDIVHSDINKTYGNTNNNDPSNDKLTPPQGNKPLLLKTKNNKGPKKRNKKEMSIVTFDEDIGEDMDDCFGESNQDVKEDGICYFHDGDEEGTLGEGESIAKAWSF